MRQLKLTDMGVRFILSLLFIVGYLSLIAAILIVESSDTMNMKAGENSLTDVLKILVGVMTAVVTQIVHFWFDSKSRNSQGCKYEAKSPEATTEKSSKSKPE